MPTIMRRLNGTRWWPAARALTLHTLKGRSRADRGGLPAVGRGDSDRPQLCRGYRQRPADGADLGLRPMARRCNSCFRRPSLRLYRTTDVIGAELGGALKNVIAIAAGVVIGAGLGDSARAALMTRGYAEMTRLALALGRAGRNAGGPVGVWRSGADLHLRRSRAISALVRRWARHAAFDPSVTVEGVATAKAVTNLAEKHARLTCRSRR